MPIINSVAELKDEASAWRRALHQNPGTSYEEVFASALVQEKLTEWGITFKNNIAKTGVVATIKGQKNTSGKSIALRADMDALNITEKTGADHASKIAGKMHACGHDGHTATLLATAKHLSENPNFDGTVHLIFQPAEEGGRGAHKMIEEGLFKDFPCDYVFGLHNWPWDTIGTAGTRTGPMMASVDEFKITITGKGGHAAFPHGTNDPMAIANQLYSAFQTIISRNVDPLDTAVLSVTNMNIGTGAVNIIADQAHITGTVRTFKPKTRKMIEERIRTICDNVAKAYNASIEIHYDHNIDATVNSADGAALAQAALEDVLGKENVNPDCEPVMGGEDFGAYTSEKPGAFVFIGQGLKNDEKSPHNQGLHSPYFDFNDDIIPIGASFFTKLVQNYMPLS